MPFILKRLLSGVSQRAGWALPLVVALFVFCTSWPLMWLAEPSGSQLVQPETYFWYFLVTSSTVGYGDFSPATAAGQVVGVYVILGGIATLTALIAKLTEHLENAKGRRMRGRKNHELTDHLVVLGYHPGRTERLVRALGHDDEDDIVVCAFDEAVESHPIPEDGRVHFVRGDLTSVHVLGRASIGAARVVLIDARDDDQALTLLAGVHQATDDNHIVVAVRDIERARTFRYVDADVRCVPWHSTRLIAEEIADPGISRLYDELMSAGGRDTFSVEVPASLQGVSYGDLQTAAGRSHGTTLLAVLVSGDDTMHVSPRWDLVLQPGDRLFYVGESRLQPDSLAQLARA